VTAFVGVDLGKTGCRARLVADGRSLLATGPGARGLADPGGLAGAAEAVTRTVDEACTRAGLEADALDSVLVGAAGAEASPVDALDLAHLLAAALRCREVGVTSDAVIAHAGALVGAPGAVVAMGTGAVSVGVGGSGILRQIDGWGYWLGDDGSGAWIGRAALRGALLAREERGQQTSLVAAAEARFGNLGGGVHAAVMSGGDVAASTAAFVPDVVACADAGDAVARDVLTSAATLLAAGVTAAADAVGETVVTAVGGLTEVPLLMDAWRRSLPPRLSAVSALGSPLDGAVLLAQRSGLPHEASVMRVTADATVTMATAVPSVAKPDVSSRVDVDLLATEQVRTDVADLDMRTPEELVDVLLAAEATVPAAVRAARTEIAAAVALVEAAFVAGGRLVYVGAGTPGRLAALDAAECPPTFGTDPGQVLAILAGGNEAAAVAIEGAEDDEDAARRDVSVVAVADRDVVVGVSASGRTPYVLAALEAAGERGAATVAVVNNPESPASRLVDVAIELLTGPEVLAGSTRLKCGTAAKVVLNTLSTAAMIRTGKSYGGWMVDVQATNEKLHRRARRILREATGVDDATAAKALEAADWRTKTALVAILANVPATEAKVWLDATGGRVRDALALTDSVVRTPMADDGSES
jgi:N-acetylmuramic acid 6-phosphate etherase